MVATDNREFCLHPKALTLLEEYVHRLAIDEGKIRVDSVSSWSSTLFSNPSSFEDLSLESSRAYMDTIQILKELSSGIKHFNESLDTFIQSRCEQILPATRHYGITSLPNEVLLAIFKKLLELHDDLFHGARRVIHDLSLVSKRFRENVLAFTDAWTYLDLNKVGPKSLRLFLDRSSNRFLKVAFIYSPRALKNLHLALHSIDRWEFIYADFEGCGDPGSLPRLLFPAVKRFEIWGIPEGDGSLPWSSPGWTFPNAEHVKAGDDIPNPEYFQYGSLKSLKYCVSSLSENHAPAFDRGFLMGFINFLRPAISIRALYLDIHFNSYPWEIRDFSLELELPNVEVFSISNSRSEYLPIYCSNKYHEPSQVDDYFCQILRMIKLPNLKDFRVVLDFRGDMLCLYTWFDEAGLVFKSVTTLTFEVYEGRKSRDRGRSVLEFYAFFTNFPALQSLTVENCSCDMVIYEDWRRRMIRQPRSPTNLESLRIKDLGTRKGRTQIEELLRDLVKLGPPLKNVDICSPYAFDIETLKEIVPGACISTPLCDDGPRVSNFSFSQFFDA